jgi:hypothetical protein
MLVPLEFRIRVRLYVTDSIRTGVRVATPICLSFLRKRVAILLCLLEVAYAAVALVFQPSGFEVGAIVRKIDALVGTLIGSESSIGSRKVAKAQRKQDTALLCALATLRENSDTGCEQGGNS